MAYENSHAYVDDIDMPDMPVDFSQSEVAQFFSGKNVLVTGGSGFMGKLLVEKLLRSCPDISKIYMFMREKKGKSSNERFKAHFEDVVYTKLRQSNPDCLKKVVMIQADTGEDDLAISPEDRKLLLHTDIIFHGAATVRFDEKLRVAANINVRGTKQLLMFAKEMPNLQAFVHVSTAFSNCVQKCIDEKVYPPPIETDKLLSILDALDDDKLVAITPTLLGKYPNTYAFTKVIAEDTVREIGAGMPTCIVRPSIVTSTFKEPIAGWINNLYGATGVVVGAGIGLLRTCPCNTDIYAEIIPADYAISNIVVAAWDTAQKWIPPTIKDAPEKKPEVTDSDQLPVYNIVSSCQSPITWGSFMAMNAKHGNKIPSKYTVWCYMLTLNKYWIMNYLYQLFLHLLPAAIIDVLALLTGRKPILLDAYKKIHKFSNVIAYFATQQWNFRNDMVLKLWDKMNATDQCLFNFNMTNFNWDEYFYYHMRGLRLYIAKDSFDSLEAGRAKYRKLKIAHYTIVTIFWMLIAWAAWKFYTFLWSMCPLSQ